MVAIWIFRKRESCVDLLVSDLAFTAATACRKNRDKAEPTMAMSASQVRPNFVTRRN
jgi:hypothetical protein